MPLYRDDQGRIYHSYRADLTGEAVRPGPGMPDDAWLRVARIKPAWVERLPRAGLCLAALSVLLMASVLPLWLLFGPVTGVAAMIGAWLVVNLGYYPLLAMACQNVAMNRPLRLITPQPGGLIALELLRPWVGLVPPAGLVLLFAQDEDMAAAVPWLLLVLGVLAMVMLALNVRFIRRLRRGAGGLRLVG